MLDLPGFANLPYGDNADDHSSDPGEENDDV